ncbi:hypothetical protein [Streptomyces lushanensis]|uniref:hypothetical protein n=1 Tax=Streptomyces lushanensis TaxID=1434255 RepID=UPI00082F4B73|nr:hypothetical protein [Streptomyces lushanensis]
MTQDIVEALSRGRILAGNVWKRWDFAPYDLGLSSLLRAAARPGRQDRAVEAAGARPVGEPCRTAISSAGEGSCPAVIGAGR